MFTVFPTGTTIYKPEKCYNGYTLYPSMKEGVGAILIDMNGNPVRTWPKFNSFMVDLLPGGSILGGQTGRIGKAYDHNWDNFSELPSLKNNSIGTHLFYLPSKNQKLELNLSHIYEYRYGGEMVDQPAHLALQSEERTHHVTMGSLDHQINFNNTNSTWITYLAAQHTARDHYTGILPDSSELNNHLIHPPYGTSATLTLQGGSQLNHQIQNFLGGSNTITIGGEYVLDDVLDEIEAYNYKVDQLTKNAGAFLQSDWEITPSFNLLSGLRADDHNMVDHLIFSPRMALMYKAKNTQLRLSWGQGFRAPQAFDSDLHIAFSGGGISRIMLGPDLKEERSNSISTSLNYDKASTHYIAGFTLEGFYTQLQDLSWRGSSRWWRTPRPQVLSNDYIGRGVSRCSDRRSTGRSRHGVFRRDVF